MEVSETGNITTNIISGSLNALVDRGGIFVSIDNLTDDSVLKVSTIFSRYPVLSLSDIDIFLFERHKHYTPIPLSDN